MTHTIPHSGGSYCKSSKSETWINRMKKRLREHSNSVKVHNFASPGATAEDDLSDQLLRFFMMFPKKDPSDPTSVLDPATTTFYLSFLYSRSTRQGQLTFLGSDLPRH